MNLQALFDHIAEPKHLDNMRIDASFNDILNPNAHLHLPLEFDSEDMFCLFSQN